MTCTSGSVRRRQGQAPLSWGDGRWPQHRCGECAPARLCRALGCAGPVGCVWRKVGSLGLCVGHVDPLPWKGIGMQAPSCAGWSLPPSLHCHGSPWSVVAQKTPASCGAAKGQYGGKPFASCLSSPAVCNGGWAAPHPLPSLAVPAPCTASASALLPPLPAMSLPCEQPPSLSQTPAHGLPRPFSATP